MKNKIFFILPILFFSTHLLAQDQLVKWINFPAEEFEVNGLPFWEENKPDLFRLSKSIKDSVREAVWFLSESPSGGRIRLRSDCTMLSIRLQYPHQGDMQNMHVFGQCGIDLYVNNRYVRTVIPKDSTFIEFTFFDERPVEMRNLTLYLPLYSGVDVLAIGVNKDAHFEEPLPFVVDQPVIYYGSSITQGGCASRPGMSYQAILSRNLNIDFVNQGYSGNGMGEPEMAEAVASMDASCYVLDFGLNLPSADSLSLVYGPFLDILRARRPDTPIIIVTPIYNAHEFWEPNKATHMRDIIRREAARLREAGDKNIILVEGFELLGPEFSDGFVDAAHPNDLGFQAMAEGLQPYVARILNVSGSNYLLRK